MKNPQDYPSISDTIASINLYVDRGIRPGSFLTAVLENDLKGAFNNADLNNREHLFEIVKYCYNEIPVDSWGSKEAVKKWLEYYDDFPR